MSLSYPRANTRFTDFSCPVSCPPLREGGWDNYLHPVVPQTQDNSGQQDSWTRFSGADGQKPRCAEAEELAS